ncbi:CD209 antigen-like protein A [Engystomops pustulosus]|uniref:CD209 antigen-like protein A n=1 Tax=Engystomops pustulosus TaxID=76066 RepID=UPI003AFB16B2
MYKKATSWVEGQRRGAEIYRNTVVTGDPDMENIYRNEMWVRTLPPVPIIESSGTEDMGKIESFFRKNWSISCKVSLLGLIALLSILLMLVCALVYPAASSKSQEGNQRAIKATEPGKHICPYLWVKKGDSCYWFSSVPENWQDAFLTCTTMESNVLTLTGKQEMDSLIPSLNGKAYWIGLRKLNFQWLWIDRTPFTFSNWGHNEPNNQGGSETCVEMKSDGWNDLYCDKKNYFICKK